MQKVYIIVYLNTLLVFKYLCNRANIRANQVFILTAIFLYSKHCIDNEREWDFLKALVSKIPDINSSEALLNEEGKKRGRYGLNSLVGIPYTYVPNFSRCLRIANQTRDHFLNKHVIPAFFNSSFHNKSKRIRHSELLPSVIITL